jgi:hypothetical protein
MTISDLLMTRSRGGQAALYEKVLLKHSRLDLLETTNKDTSTRYFFDIDNRRQEQKKGLGRKEAINTNIIIYLIYGT